MDWMAAIAALGPGSPHAMDPWRVVVLAVMLGFAVGPGWLRKRQIRATIGRDPMLVQPLDTPYGCAQAILGVVVGGYYLLALTYALAPDVYALVPRFTQPPDAVRVGGAGLALVAIVLTWVAQGQMGLSWRFGPDRDAPPPLVTTGLFAYVRNPVYASTMLLMGGFFAMLPDAIAYALLWTGLAGLHMLVRLEEQFLLGVHGEPYRAYCTRVPRFVPGLRGTRL